MKLEEKEDELAKLREESLKNEKELRDSVNELELSN